MGGATWPVGATFDVAAASAVKNATQLGSTVNALTARILRIYALSPSMRETTFVVNGLSTGSHGSEGAEAGRSFASWAWSCLKSAIDLSIVYDAAELSETRSR